MDKKIGLSVLSYFYQKLLTQIKDINGDLMPKENPFATADWDVDSNNDLMPKILKE